MHSRYVFENETFNFCVIRSQWIFVKFNRFFICILFLIKKLILFFTKKWPREINRHLWYGQKKKIWYIFPHLFHQKVENLYSKDKILLVYRMGQKNLQLSILQNFSVPIMKIHQSRRPLTTHRWVVHSLNIWSIYFFCHLNVTPWEKTNNSSMNGNERCEKSSLSYHNCNFIYFHLIIPTLYMNWA